jgi:Family of unknown function (DUF5683)
MRNRSFTPWSIAGLTLVFALSINYSAPQAKITSALIKPDTTETLSPSQDTLKYEFTSVKISDEKQAKSGNLAMLFSAILPGSGQVYAHRYITIPLILGFGYYFASTAINANNQYMDYRGKYAESVRSNTINHSGDTNSYSLREFYHNQRDQFIFYLALTYFLNIIDAYVGATLYDFSVSDELGGNAKIRFQMPLR